MSFKLKNPLLKLFVSNKSKKPEQLFIEAIVHEDMEQLRKLTKDKIKVIAPLFWTHENEHVYPIHLGCALGSLDVVKFLFRIGCTLEMKTEDGKTPLHYAAAHNCTHPEVTGHLLDMGAKTNVKDKSRGFTAFHCACESNNYGAAKRLLEISKGFALDNSGKTAKDIAIENDADQIVALFVAHEEESQRKQALMTLPSRIEQLEMKTEYLFRHQSLQSGINDSGLEDNSQDVFDFLNVSSHNISTTAGPDGVIISPQRPRSITLDDAGARIRRLSGSLHSLQAAHGLSLRYGHLPPLLSVNESLRVRDHRATAGSASGLQMPLTADQSLPPAYNTLASSPTLDSPQEDHVLTRESPLGKIQRHQVQRNYSFLHSMMKPEKVVIKLFSKNHLDLSTKENISKLPTQQDKNDCILSNHVLKGSMGLYEDFLQSLKDSNQSHIAARLTRISDSPIYNSNQLQLTKHRESTV